MKKRKEKKRKEERKRCEKKKQKNLFRRSKFLCFRWFFLPLDLNLAFPKKKFEFFWNLVSWNLSVVSSFFSIRSILRGSVLFFKLGSRFSPKPWPSNNLFTFEVRFKQKQFYKERQIFFFSFLCRSLDPDIGFFWFFVLFCFLLVFRVDPRYWFFLVFLYRLVVLNGISQI